MKKSMLQPTVVQYEVGPDISEVRYLAAVEAIAEWFKEWRDTKEPLAAAKRTLDCCLKGVKPSDGVTPWTSMATATLRSRVRSACRFDLDTMKPLRKSTPERREKKQLERDKVREKKQTTATDPNYPSEYRKPAVEGSYGTDPLTFFTTVELEKRGGLKEAYLSDFPQLNSVASQSKLDMLLDLNLLLERIRFRQAKETTPRQAEQDIQTLTKQIVELEKALNIHPDQLAKQQREKEGGTIGDAVRRLEESQPVELRERWFAEELIMLYQMYHAKSPRQNTDGHQLDEVGLFGLTRCRTCACSSCGTRNYAGLNIEEIETWLQSRGHLELLETPVDLAVQAAATAEFFDEEPPKV